MYQNYRVVTFCPAGRRRYMELLLDNLLPFDHIIDEHRFCVNTDNEEDIAWMRAAEKEHPDFVRVIENAEFGHQASPENRAAFYRGTCDPDTIYIKLDDDIVYVSPGGIDHLLRFRCETPEPFLVFPCIINDAVVTHILQCRGVIPVVGIGPVGLHRADHYGWESGESAETLHREFLRGGSRIALQEPFLLEDFTGPSINAVCFFGRDMAASGGEVPPSDECYLADFLPRELARPSAITFGCVVAHFAFFTQRDHLDKTDILAHYRALAESNKSRGHIAAAAF